MIRIAILDLYEGKANEGMRCLRQIIKDWSDSHQIQTSLTEFEVRRFQQVPDLTYDIYISSGGPGSPLESKDSDWEKIYFNWFSQIEEWNNNAANNNKKFIFFICHSFELICRHYGLAKVAKRKSTAFGVFPVHLTEEGKKEIVFEGLADPFYVVDSRDWQIIEPDAVKIKDRKISILCVEKERPHVPYERAIMAMRFNDHMI